MEDQIKDFIHFLTIEKGLAKNTIISYERDLKSILQYLKNVEQMNDWNDSRRANIMHFLAHLKDQGKSRKRLARHIASIRSFHQFLTKRKSNRTRSIQYILKHQNRNEDFQKY